jgi:hypothetical protein
MTFPMVHQTGDGPFDPFRIGPIPVHIGSSKERRKRGEAANLMYDQHERPVQRRHEHPAFPVLDLAPFRVRLQHRGGDPVAEFPQAGDHEPSGEAVAEARHVLQHHRCR